MSKDRPGTAAWKKVRFELEQSKNPTILDGTNDTYMVDCLETRVRYIVSLGKVVSKREEKDIDWNLAFDPTVKPFGHYA